MIYDSDGVDAHFWCNASLIIYNFWCNASLIITVSSINTINILHLGLIWVTGSAHLDLSYAWETELLPQRTIWMGGPSSALVTIIWNHHGIIQPSTAWQSSLYHCFIKHGNGKSLRNRGFITNITDQWSVFQQCLTTPEATFQRNQRTHGNHELPVVVIPNCSLWLPSENHYNWHQGTIHTTSYRVW